MKLYNTKNGIVAAIEGKLYSLGITDWDSFINDDQLFDKVSAAVAGKDGVEGEAPADVVTPLGSQELWACGVTYMRSKLGRQEESKDAGGGDFYDRVYYADRPEVFFKSTPGRVVGPGQQVRIRKDSTWDVPEPELTLVVSSSGKIVAYTIGNDMSSRSIEGENPLYLPQAKTYDACAAVGPCIYVSKEKISAETEIELIIKRDGAVAFEGKTAVNQMKRTPEELASFVYRECSFPNGCYIMTGTGIVPDNNFTLKSGDEISIAIAGIGVLVNTVA